MLTLNLCSCFSVMALAHTESRTEMLDIIEDWTAESFGKCFRTCICLFGARSLLDFGVWQHAFQCSYGILLFVGLAIRHGVTSFLVSHLS